MQMSTKQSKQNNQSSTQLPEVSSVKQLADYLGIHARTLYSMVVAGKIPHFRAGRRILFYRDNVVEWLRGQGAHE